MPARPALNLLPTIQEAIANLLMTREPEFLRFGFSLFMGAAFALLAFVHQPVTGVAAMLVIGFLTGFIVWQYADVRGAYPEALTGRAMAVFTMAMFLGVALVQWLTGVIATLAHEAGFDPYTAVLLGTAALVALGTLAFRSLPAPRSAP